MFPYASCHNLRLVSVNLRDYTGSSAYSPSELQMLADADFEAQVSIIRDQGREIAAFLVHYIKGQGIPPIGRREGKRTGGVSLLAWSLANIVSLSFLGNASSLDQETQTFLEAYLRNVVLYGSLTSLFAVTLSDDAARPPQFCLRHTIARRNLRSVQRRIDCAFGASQEIYDLGLYVPWPSLRHHYHHCASHWFPRSNLRMFS